METKKIVLSIITVLVFVILCSQIKVEKNKVGEEIDYDKTWEETAEKFPILNAIPKFTDKVDYWRAQTLTPVNGYGGVNISFKEVDNPKKKADEIEKLFLNAGFTFVEESSNEGKNEPYQAVKYKREYKYTPEGVPVRLDVQIKYFDYTYPLSHNVTVLIFVRNPK